jgi:hypothetical protein
MNKPNNVTGKVIVSRWDAAACKWNLYSNAHSYSLEDFSTAKKMGEVQPDDGTFLFQFESEGEENIHDYFLSDVYAI